MIVNNNIETKASPKIFIICCLALLVTSMTFAIRAGILNQLGAEFTLNDSQLGWVNSMAFLGFPIALSSNQTIVSDVINKSLDFKLLKHLDFKYAK